MCSGRPENCPRACGYPTRASRPIAGAGEYCSPTPLGIARRFERLLDGQRPSEAEFVAVGVDQVEEALTPFGIAGRGSWFVSRCARTVVKRVDIGNVEDD